MAHEVWIYDVIGKSFFEEGVTGESFRDSLAGVDKNETLNVRINSPGGAVNEAVSIKTMLDQHKGTVNVQIDGLAASAASYIAMSGDNITIADGSFLMIHAPWSTGYGNATELREQADKLDRLGDSLQKAYAKRTGIAKDEILRLMAATTWYTADEAIEAGFADSLIEEHKAAAFVIPAAFGFKNVPSQVTPTEPKQRIKNEVESLKRRMELKSA